MALNGVTSCHLEVGAGLLYARWPAGSTDADAELPKAPSADLLPREPSADTLPKEPSAAQEEVPRGVHFLV